MRQLKFVGLSEDGTNVVLQSLEDDELFMLPIDERLRAASRGDVARLGQIEIELESALRPRDIQARIRAGESPQEIAASAGMDLERVQRFAYPVLQEREQVATEARRSPLKHPDGSQTTLGDLVNERLSMRHVDPDRAVWDSWRADDGRWTVAVRWRSSAADTVIATWAFSLGDRSTTALDELAEDLISDHPRPVQTVTPVTPLAAAAAQVAPPRAPQAPRPSVISSVPPVISSIPSTQAAGPETSNSASADDDEERAARARVPAWDDILLGVRRR